MVLFTKEYFPISVFWFLLLILLPRSTLISTHTERPHCWLQNWGLVGRHKVISLSFFAIRPPCEVPYSLALI
jgi:hypothetical protein